jgi:ATP-dependent Clp protease ATP-binding subunit ClpX
MSSQKLRAVNITVEGFNGTTVESINSCLRLHCQRHIPLLVQPEDLVKFGMIPEFVGRLPLIASLHALGEDALFNILTEPKNAIVKQYKKLFRMEGVELILEDAALKAVVQRAIERGTGARTLRSIIEEIMLDIMYHLPDRRNLATCAVTKDVILKRKDPVYTFEERKSA